MSENKPQYLSIAAVAKVLSVSRWTVSRIIDDGELIAEEHRGSIRISVRDFDEYVARKRAAAIKAAEDRRQAKSVTMVRPVGRPRKVEVKSDSAPKRPVGRPRKDQSALAADAR
ncbi:MAG: helix-turn-helix domain-containing protein [Rhodospirillaceae bacterium]|nr:helix-turn-helix domain-containing protein [Rhodospirillales bacterium]